MVEVRRVVRAPATWHCLSLVAGFGVILFLQRAQWFFFDEWAFLQLEGPAPLEPHVGHLSLAPTLIYQGLRATFGLDQYFPFALLVTILHLAAAHLIWRVAIRSGANPWLATAGVTVFIFLGSGAENILWAFQIGFVGALVLGLVAFLLAAHETMSRPRLAILTAVAAFSLAWSGTAIPLIVATSLLLWQRHGWRKAAIFTGITAALFLTWYVLFAIGSPSNPDTGGFAPEKIFVLIPQFIGVMVILGFGDVFPVIGLGALVLLAVAVWIVAMVVRRAGLAVAMPALALTVGAATFALMSAYSRAAFSVGSGRASRYVYLLVLLLLPVLTVAMTRLLRRNRAAIAVGSALLLALSVYQGVLLWRAADAQAELEQETGRLLSASLWLYLDDPARVALGAGPDPRWAPDLDMRDLVALYDGGYLTIQEFTPEDLRQAESNVLIRE